MSFNDYIRRALRNASRDYSIVRDKGHVTVKPAITRKRISKQDMKEVS